MPSLELNLVDGSVVKTSWRRSFTMSFVGLDQLAWLFFSSSSLGERRDQCAWRESALPSRRIIIRPSDFFPRSRCQTCGISIKQPTKASIGTEQTTETMVTFLTPWHDRIPWTGWEGCNRRNNCGANATVPSIEVYGQLGVGKSRHLYALSILISSRIYVYMYIRFTGRRSFFNIDFRVLVLGNREIYAYLDTNASASLSFLCLSFSLSFAYFYEFQ